jgi:hypothetical protein
MSLHIRLVLCPILQILLSSYSKYAFRSHNDLLTDTLQVRFATNYLFDVGLYFPKFSMLAFYYRIVPLTAPETRIALHATTGFVVVSALITFFGDTFWCGPNPAINWYVFTMSYLETPLT